MDSIKVLWMNNGDESLLHHVENAKSYGLEIETCNSMKECRIKLESYKGHWEAIIINAVCRMEEERPKISNISNAVKFLRGSYRDIPRFVVINDDKLSYNVRTRLEVLENGEEKFLLMPSPSSLFEAIKVRVANNPEVIIKRKYANVLHFFPEKQLTNLLIKLDSPEIEKDTTVPNSCRILLERLKNSSLFANMYISDKIFKELDEKHKRDNDKKSFTPENYNELSLNDFSYAFGLSPNVPIHVKRSIFACTSVNQPGSHDTNINKMIEQGKAPYATKTLIMELLNVIEWCSQQNPNTIKL